MKLETLYQIIKNRKNTMPNDSYVASLFRGKKDRIIQKIGEEATEVVIAAKNKETNEIITEIADLWFHSLILMVSCDISYDEILRELAMRNKNKMKQDCASYKISD